MSIRHADLAGSWYPSRPAALTAAVEECLRDAEERYGTRPQPGRRPVALVTPHAGLAFSGAVAAAAYGLLREALGRVDTFVVFGACHRARLNEPAIWAEGAWETPLGVIEIDTKLAMKFVDGGVGAASEAPHYGDNAIELQTPFIKHFFPEARMVPAAVSSRVDSWRRGKTAARLAEGEGRRVVAVASTDLTHYGSSFGVMPAGTGLPALEWLRKNDARFIRALVEMRLEDIVLVAERDGSACGGGAAAATAGWANAMGCKCGRLLAYTNSHAVMPRGEADHMVGYASVAYEAETPDKGR